jgi:hypothetical protein
MSASRCPVRTSADIRTIAKPARVAFYQLNGILPATDSIMAGGADGGGSGVRCPLAF